LACAGTEKLHSSKLLMIANTTGNARLLRRARQASHIVLLPPPNLLPARHAQLCSSQVTEGERPKEEMWLPAPDAGEGKN
jgi:hypothetical protein